MDLFGDLPEPGQTKHAVTSLYDNLPAGDHRNTTDKTTDEFKPANRGEKRKSEDEDTDVSRIKPSVRYRLKGYFAARKGEREDMQDSHVMIDDFTSEFSQLDPSIHRLSIYGAYDGHGGARASRFASQNLHKNLRLKFPKGDISQVEKEIKKIFVETFKKTDEDFLKEATKYKPAWKDGTTVVVVLVINDTLYIANLGDSQAFLCRRKEDTGKLVPVHLTTVHNPAIYEERIRIQKAGGHVKEGRVMGVLEVSRSFGDGQYKKHGVSCVPDIKRCQLTDEDRFLVIACDGLWKSFNPEECVNFTHSILEDQNLEGTEQKSSEVVRFETACTKLANTAVLRLSSDNVTVLLVSINKNRS